MESMTKDQRPSGSTNGDRRPKAPDPEVAEKAKRRRHSAQYKLRILTEIDACTEPGEAGQILRREGLYRSHIAKWRRERREGSLAGLTPKKRGPRHRPTTPESSRVNELEKENRRLQREKERLEAKLRRADLMLDLQKKVSELFNIPLEQPPSDEDEESS